jgi:hypothetical protein
MTNHVHLVVQANDNVTVILQLMGKPGQTYFVHTGFLLWAVFVENGVQQSVRGSVF